MTKLALLAVVLSVLACTPTNYVVNNLPSCSQAEIDEWNRVHNSMQGVKAFDPVGNTIYHPPAEKDWVWPFGYINNWIPLSSQKQTLCGELHHFNVYDGGGAEMDWNNFVIPNPDFDHLITNALPYKGGDGIWCVDDDWHTCEGNNYCMEAEITPDQSFYENPWFPKSVGASILEGRDVCFYGPWIRECVHGHRPEIHPSEMIWWKENKQYVMMVVQDDSNRFDERGDFDTDGLVPSNWKPWAKPPMTAQFKIAFQASPLQFGLPLKMSINDDFKRFVVTSEDSQASADADNGTSHTLVVNGRSIITVEEKQANDRDIGVKFVDLCVRSNGTIQGYVQLTTMVGGEDIGGDEGYHVIYATEPAPNIPDVVLANFAGTLAKPRIKQGWDLNAVRAVPVDGGQTLVGTLNLNSDKTAITSVQTLNSDGNPQVNTAARRTGQTAFQLVNFPLFEPSTITVNLATDSRTTVRHEGLRLMSLPIDSEYKGFKKDDQAWALYARQVLKSTVAPPGIFGAAKTVDLLVTPLYVPVREGQAHAEEGSPVSEYLNESIAKESGQRMRNLAKKQNPFTLKWKFKAINLNTGKGVKVTTGSSGPNEAVKVSIGRKHYENDQLNVQFPSDGGVYELRATLQLQDEFGNRSDKTYTLWSHYAQADQNEPGVKQLMEFSGTIKKDRPVLSTAAPKNPGLQTEALRLYITDAAKDKTLTIREIEAIAGHKARD